MPWEKSFDIDQAIDRATEVFWAKGYDSASLADLMKATGINKGSFYNAFGSKKKLFAESLLKYYREQHRATLEKLAAMQDPVAAFSAFFDALIEQSVTDKQRKGCLLVNTALDLPNHDKETNKMVKKALADVERFFKQQIELGQKDQAIPKTVDPEVTAKALLALVVGLRVLARGVFDRNSLQAIKTQAIELVT